MEAIIAKVDFLANRGALVMRAAAVFTWGGAAAATVAVFEVLGWPGWVVGVVCLFPGFVLWRYGNKLANALDATKIRGQLGDAADLAKMRLGEVVGGLKATRSQPVRGGFRVLKVVRTLRSDLDGFGVDVAGITELSNPASMVAAAISLAAGVALWILAAIGVLIRLVL